METYALCMYIIVFQTINLFHYKEYIFISYEKIKNKMHLQPYNPTTMIYNLLKIKIIQVVTFVCIKVTTAYNFKI